jgi:peptidoglycan/LPS O-acetylase OafA/YrhL
MTSDLQTKGRLDFLDGIRGLAALAVFVEHAGDTLWPQFRVFTHNSFSFGKFGVAAFFLTSGFVIPFSLERSNSLRNFWISRFFRLYPLYWLSLGLAIGLYLLGVSDAVSVSFPQHLIRNAVINLTMFQDFVRVPNAEGLYYTLAMEMAFYIFFSVLFLKRWNRQSLLIAWSWGLMLAMCGVLAPVLLHRRLPMAGLFYFLCLFVGTAIYRNYTREISGKALSALLVFVLLATTMDIYFNYVFVKKDDPTEHFTLFAVFLPWGAAYTVLLAGYLLRSYKFPQVLIWLGTVSYSVYLLHPLCIRVVPRLSNSGYSFVAMLLLTLLAANFTYRNVEQPFITHGKKLNLRFSSTHAAKPSTHGVEATANLDGHYPIIKTAN